MTHNDTREALEDSIRRFLLDGEGDRCPECSSELIETATFDGRIAAANCRSCEFMIETDEPALLPDEGVVWGVRRFL